MTPLEYIGSVVIAIVTGVGVGVIVWAIRHKLFL